MQEKLLSIREVAKRLDVNERWVADRLRSGDLPGFKLGKKWRIQEWALEQFVKGKTLV